MTRTVPSREGSSERRRTPPVSPQQPPSPEPVPDAVLSRACEIIPDRLYFVSLKGHPRSSKTQYFWTADYDLVYTPFEADFGPLNLSSTVRFCRAAHRHLREDSLAEAKIYFYSSHDGHKRANAGFLIGAFQVLVLDRTPAEAWATLAPSYPPFLPFRDASCGVSEFNCTILHCLQGLACAKDHGWIDWRRFDCEEYDYHEVNGDWNWIVPPSAHPAAPGKFIAFSAPYDNPEVTTGPYRQWRPEEYRQVFRAKGITSIVRLCKRTYDRRKFTEHGFRHIDLIYPDGSTPSDAVVKAFLSFAEESPGGVAVHCKAGLGRTGTLIGCYIMKHYGFTAEAAIAWMRICRPGSVIGPQQQYLQGIECRVARDSAVTPPPRGGRLVSRQSKGLASLSNSKPSTLKTTTATRAPSLNTSCASERVDLDPHTSQLLRRSSSMQDELDKLLRSTQTQRRGTPMTSATWREKGRDLASWEEQTEKVEAADLQDCMAKCSVLTMSSLRTLRNMKAPPLIVQRAVLAMMALLGFKDLSWEVAREKLAGQEMVSRFKTIFDSDLAKAPGEYLNLVSSFVNDPKCSPQAVERSCSAAGSVATWVHSVAKYCVALQTSQQEQSVLPPVAADSSRAVSAPAPLQSPPKHTRATNLPRKRLQRPPASLLFADEK